MAVENRGGANGGPQYSPTNVSGTGGAGQSGRAASGYAYGMNKQINEQAAGAPLAKVAPVAARSMNVAPELPPVTPITDPTMLPDESVMAGINMGAGPGAEALMLPSMNDSAAEFNKSISSYYPVLSYIASRESTSPETRRALAIIMNEVQ